MGRKPTWSQDQMDAALHHYFNTEDGLRICSRKYGIPKATLSRYVRKYRDRYETKGSNRSQRVRNRSKTKDGPTSSAKRSKPSRTGSKPFRNGSEPSETGGSKLSTVSSTDPGATLGQVHAHKLLQLQGKLPWWCGLMFLGGMVFQELYYRKTGRLVFEWLFPRSQEEVAKKSEETVLGTEDTTEGLAEKEEGNPNLPRNSRYVGKGLNIG